MITKQQRWQSLGMIQWQLRRPQRLSGVCPVPVATTRLVVLAESSLLLDTPLLQDVFQLLQLTAQQINSTTPEKLLTTPARALFWCLGTPVPLQASRYIISPPLAELLLSPVAKRQLWQEIAYYVDDYSVDS